MCSNSSACCAGGPSKIVTVTPTTDSSDNVQLCCKADEVPKFSGTAQGMCAPSGVSKRDEHAFNLATRPVRRDLQDDPLRQISFREDSTRIALSPHLVADMLLNDHRFEYRGRTFIDHEGRKRSQNYWQRSIAKRIPGFVKYGGAKILARNIANVRTQSLYGRLCSI